MYKKKRIPNKRIEAKYIRGKVSKHALINLKPREFEYLIELLYQQLGYSTGLAPATRDGKMITCSIR